MNDVNTRAAFVSGFRHIQKQVHETAVGNGFWEDPVPTKGDKIALIHSEVSELLEAVRKPDRKDEHLPHLHPEALELADTVIRIMDYAERYGLDVAGAILAKGDYNSRRPYKHGGKKL